MSDLYVVDTLSFNYRLGAQDVPALKDISFRVPAGSFTALAGPSGSGKTTLLNVLGLIESVQHGNVDLDGVSLSHLSEARKNTLRRYKIGFVFQNFHLFPTLTAQENVAYFVARQGVARAERTRRVDMALRAVGLWEHRDQKPLEMSGGQRQRVAIARALAKKPSVIIADEPTASLDQQTGQDIMTILETLNRELKVTIVVSSHDPMVLARARQHITLRDGQVTHAN